jgi:hypothetical protein
VRLDAGVNSLPVATVGGWVCAPAARVPHGIDGFVALPSGDGFSLFGGR